MRDFSQKTAGFEDQANSHSIPGYPAQAGSQNAAPIPPNPDFAPNPPISSCSLGRRFPEDHFPPGFPLCSQRLLGTAPFHDLSMSRLNKSLLIPWSCGIPSRTSSHGNEPSENPRSRAGRARPDPTTSSTNSAFPKLHSVSFSQRTKLNRISQGKSLFPGFLEGFLSLWVSGT